MTKSDHFMDWMTVQKGGRGSGHWEHSGRPGHRGGSAPKSGGIPAIFKGDRARYEAAMREYGASDDPRKLSSVRNALKWQIGLDPKNNNYQTEYQLSEMYDKFEPPKLPNGTTDYEAWNDAYAKAKPGFTLSREEYLALLPDVERRYQARMAVMREKGGIPDTIEEIFGMDNLPNIYNYSGTTPEQRAVQDQLFKKGRDFARETVAKLGLDDWTGSEIRYEIFQDLEEKLTAKYGEYKYNESSPEYQAKREWLMSLQTDMSSEVEFQASVKVYAGEWTTEDLNRGGYNIEGPGNQGENLQPLPKDLWHVTTNAAAIRAAGIQSRYELGMYQGPGLGGGSDKTISFSTDEKIGETIERALHEGHLVGKGEINAHMLLQAAQNGLGGVGTNWAWEAVTGKPEKPTHPEYEFSGRGDGKKRAVQNLLDYEEGKPVTDWQGNKWDQDTYMKELWSYYSGEYMYVREYAGGFGNPLFFSTDYKKLASLDPKQFKTLRFRPSSTKVKGWQMGSLAEWRVVGKNAVKLVGSVDHFNPDDPDFLEKLLGGAL